MDRQIGRGRGAAGRELLEDQRGVEPRQPGAAVLLADVDAGEAELGGRAQRRYREDAVLVPLGGVRRQLAAGEAPRAGPGTRAAPRSARSPSPRPTPVQGPRRGGDQMHDPGRVDNPACSSSHSCGGTLSARLRPPRNAARSAIVVSRAAARAAAILGRRAHPRYKRRQHPQPRTTQRVAGHVTPALCPDRRALPDHPAAPQPAGPLVAPAGRRDTGSTSPT